MGRVVSIVVPGKGVVVVSGRGVVIVVVVVVAIVESKLNQNSKTLLNYVLVVVEVGVVLVDSVGGCAIT